MKEYKPMDIYDLEASLQFLPNSELYKWRKVIEQEIHFSEEAIKAGEEERK